MHFSWKGEMCQNSIHDVQHSPLTKKVSERALILIIFGWKHYVKVSNDYFPNKTVPLAEKVSISVVRKITEPHHGFIRRIYQLHKDPNCWLEQLHLSCCTDIVHFISIWVIRYLKLTANISRQSPIYYGQISLNIKERVS